MESISRILSSTTKAATNVAQTENNLTAQPLAEYRIASTSTTMIGSKLCFTEIT